MDKHRKALLVVFLTVFIDLVGFGIIIPLSPYLARKFGADALQVGLLMSIYSLMQFIFAPFWGSLSDRVGRRPIILLSLLGAALSHLLFAFGAHLPVLFVARALAGFFGGNISTAMAYVADVTASKDRSKGMGLIGAAFGLGFILGPFIGGISGYLGLELGEQPPLGESFPALVAAFICFSNFVLAYFVLAESLRPSQRDDLVARRHSRLLAVFKLYQRPVLGTVMLVYFLTIFAMANMEVSLFLYVREKFNWSLIEASWGFAYVGVIIAFVQGYLIRKLLPMWGERKLIFLGIPFFAFGLGLIGWSDSIILLAIAVTVLGLGSGLASPALTGAISQLCSETEQGIVMGANQSLAAMARIVGPALGGWLYRDLGWSSPFFVGGVFALFALALILPKLSAVPNAGKTHR